MGTNSILEILCFYPVLPPSMLDYLPLDVGKCKFPNFHKVGTW